VKESRDPKSSGKSPDEKAAADPKSGRNSSLPPAGDAVAEHKRHVRPRHDDDHCGDGRKGEDVSHLTWESVTCDPLNAASAET
jgi:hypothetical protein